MRPPQILRVTPDTNAVNVTGRREANSSSTRSINDRGTDAQERQRTCFSCRRRDGDAARGLRIASDRRFVRGTASGPTRRTRSRCCRASPICAATPMKTGATSCSPPGRRSRRCASPASRSTGRRAAVRRALIEAVSPDSIVYLAQSDSAGRFAVGPLPAGPYLVRGDHRSESEPRARTAAKQFDTVASDRTAVRAHRAARSRRATRCRRAHRQRRGRSTRVTLRVMFDRLLDPVAAVPGRRRSTWPARTASRIPIAAVRTPREEAALASRAVAGGSRLRAPRRLARRASLRVRRGTSDLRRARLAAEPPSRARAPFTTISLVLPRQLAAATRVVSRARNDDQGAQRSRDGKRTHLYRRRGRRRRRPAADTTAPPGGPHVRRDRDGPRRALPSVGALLESARGAGAARLARRARSSSMRCARDDRARARRASAAPARRSSVGRRDRRPPRTRRARRRCAASINATGIVLHTNLGRAPLAGGGARRDRRAWRRGYSNLEFDLDARRARLALRALRGAAARAHRRRGRARGQQLRGRAACSRSTRSPTGARRSSRAASSSRSAAASAVHEIMAKSGARLREVGATNRTHLADYEQRDRRAAPARCSRCIAATSRSHGFTAEATVPELAARSRCARRPGRCTTSAAALLVSLEASACAASRPRARRSRRGAPIVVMSGDKLLGGPQAGMIVGDATLARRDAQESARALVPRRQADPGRARGDARALSRARARAARDPDAGACSRAIAGALRERAEALRLALQRDGITARRSRRRAASARARSPTRSSPAPRSRSPATPRDGLRDSGRASPAVVGRVHDGRMLLDLRAVLPRRAARARARRGGRAWLTGRGRRAPSSTATARSSSTSTTSPIPIASRSCPARPRPSPARACGSAIGRLQQSVRHRPRARHARAVPRRARAGRTSSSRMQAQRCWISFVCPHHEQFTGPCACRKPGTLLFERAATLHGLDLSRSMFVGDKHRDVAPAVHVRRAGVPGALARHARGARGSRARGGRRSGRFAARGGATLSGARAVTRARASPCSRAAAAPISRRSSTISPRSARLGTATSCSSRRIAPTRARWLEPSEPASRTSCCGRRMRPMVWSLVRRSHAHRAQIVALAGYMRLVSPDVTVGYRGRMLNVHPALLPDFGGPGMYGPRVHRAVLQTGATQSGSERSLRGRGVRPRRGDRAVAGAGAPARRRAHARGARAARRAPALPAASSTPSRRAPSARRRWAGRTH